MFRSARQLVRRPGRIHSLLALRAATAVASNYLFRIRQGQRIISGIDDEDRQKTGRFGLAGVFADLVVGAGLFIEAVACLVDSWALGPNCSPYSTAQHECVN